MGNVCPICAGRPGHDDAQPWNPQWVQQNPQWAQQNPQWAPHNPQWAQQNPCWQQPQHGSQPSQDWMRPHQQPHPHFQPSTTPWGPWGPENRYGSHSQAATPPHYGIAGHTTSGAAGPYSRFDSKPSRPSADPEQWPSSAMDASHWPSHDQQPLQHSPQQWPSSAMDASRWPSHDDKPVQQGYPSRPGGGVVIGIPVMPAIGQPITADSLMPQDWIEARLPAPSISTSSGSGRLPCSYSGNYDWIRKANGPDDRARRRDGAQATVAACKAEHYSLDGFRIELRMMQRMCSSTRIVRAGWDARGPDMRHQVKWFKHAPGQLSKVAISCAGAGAPVALVNAASAYNAGGGFVSGGRHALEESLCMQSTLFQSLKVAKEQASRSGVLAPASCMPPFKLDGSPWECYIPEDGVVLSPDVEFFRGGSSEGYPFLPKAQCLTAVITLAMPNCNQRVRDAPVDAPSSRDAYFSLLVTKFTAVLSAAVQVGAQSLVIPDVGCGVYENKPRDVGHAFGESVRSRFPHSFSEIHLVGQPEFTDAAEEAGAILV